MVSWISVQVSAQLTEYNILLKTGSRFHSSPVLRPYLCVKLSRVGQFSFRTSSSPVLSRLFSTSCPHEYATEESFSRLRRQSFLQQRRTVQTEICPRIFSTTPKCTSRSPHTRLWPLFCTQERFFFVLTPHTGSHSVRPGSTLPHPSSLSRSFQQNLVSPTTLEHSSARLSADNSTQTLGTPLTRSRANQGSDLAFQQQQNEVLTDSLNTYQTTLR